MSAPESTCPILVADDGSLYMPVPGRPELRFTPSTENDIDDLVSLFGHPLIGKWAYRRQYPYTKESTAFLIDLLPKAQDYLSAISASLPSPPPDFPMESFPLSAVRETDTGRLVGYVYASPSPREPGGGVEIAYDIQPELWGRGIGKAMISGLLEFAKWSKVKRVLAYCEENNVGSGAVLRKCGFTKYKEMTLEWPEDKGGGERLIHGYEIHL
ncbi:hypothetical protein IAT38_004970 [Cryptococcus sp. DSM 104549]